MFTMAMGSYLLSKTFKDIVLLYANECMGSLEKWRAVYSHFLSVACSSPL